MISYDKLWQTMKEKVLLNIHLLKIIKSALRKSQN